MPKSRMRLSVIAPNRLLKVPPGSDDERNVRTDWSETPNDNGCFPGFDGAGSFAPNRLEGGWTVAHLSGVHPVRSTVPKPLFLELRHPVRTNAAAAS
jgi:hypothetical protein